MEQATAPAEAQPSSESQSPAQPDPPQTEQVGEQQAQRQPSKPVQPDARALLAGLNRAQQTNAAMKQALGLSARATDAEATAKIEELLRGPSVEAAGFDPEVSEREAQAIEREWQLAERVSGAEQVALARQVQELALTNTPLDFMDAVNELLSEYVRKAQAQQPAAEAPTNGQPKQQAPPRDVAPEGDGPVGLEMKPEQDEVGTGDIEGAARRAFAAIFPGRR